MSDKKQSKEHPKPELNPGEAQLRLDAARLAEQADRFIHIQSGSGTELTTAMSFIEDACAAKGKYIESWQYQMAAAPQEVTVPGNPLMGQGPTKMQQVAVLYSALGIIQRPGGI